MIRIGLVTLALAAASLLMAGTTKADNMAKTPTNKATMKQATMKQAWAPESLSGTIMMVNPASHLLVVLDANGVPFDLRITPATKIDSNGARVSLQNLAQAGDLGRNVTVRMVPERKGDIARSIDVTG